MITDPPDDVGRFKNTGLMVRLLPYSNPREISMQHHVEPLCESLSRPAFQIKALEVSGFGSIHTYDEVCSLFSLQERNVLFIARQSSDE